MYKPDFVTVRTKVDSRGPGDEKVTYWPEFHYWRTEDLMIRGHAFYAAWDEERGVWTTSIQRLCEIIDSYLDWYASSQEIPSSRVAHIRDNSTKLRVQLDTYLKYCEDNFIPLDSEVTFLGESKPKDAHISTCVPYKMEAGEPECYDRLMEVLYDPTEREKLEWAIGSVISGDSKRIQKFIVLYGDSGTGKSTFLRIVKALFPGKYSTVFDSKALGENKNSFVLDTFKDNPLVAIQDDGDLSRIKDNTKLNQIVSHEELLVEEKYKSPYPLAIQSFLFMGTNRPVEITEARSGIARRLIDVVPSGRLVSPKEYNIIFPRILNSELGKIARHCLDVYLRLGPNAYDSYRPERMVSGTNQIYNFISDNLIFFMKNRKMVSREDMWNLYKQWLEDAGDPYRLKRIAFGLEMEAYFKEYRKEYGVRDGDKIKHYRNVYFDFKSELFDHYEPEVEQRAVEPSMLILDQTDSRLETIYADAPAQYFVEEDGVERLERKWDNCTTRLKDLDTSKLHGVRYEPNHIVIDFDLKNASGEKDKGLNLAAAARWPETYAELSKSGQGVHLHYLYDGDPAELAPEVSPHIEVKTMVGKSCDRRMHTLSNDSPITMLSEGALPKKGERRSKVIDIEGFKNEKKLRSQIQSALQRKVHPNTRPSVDFIFKLLEEAWNSGEYYDVTDLRPKVMAFANNSTNQSVYCLKLVSQMHFCCAAAEAEPEEAPLAHVPKDGKKIVPDEELTFFDIEIFPNVFIICYKHYGDSPVLKMINPTPEEVRNLYKYNLVGFNNRSYDNHIIWAAGMLSYTPYQLYTISKRIIEKDPSFKKFPQAYNLSYTDVYDFASAPNKKGLKKWEIELGINHVENHYDWDKPLDESKWFEICDYCANDVLATEAVFNHIHEDYTARCILAQLADSVPNQSTRNLTKRILFKGDPNPRSKLVYTDLSEMFPGYKYENGVSTYRGYTVGEGGFVWAVPGMYPKTKTLDVESMHPTSAEQLEYLGPYTKTYSEIKQARIAIKHKDYDRARGLLDGVLGPFLDDPDLDPRALSNALKTFLNALYGYTHMTSALDFVHPKNKDNIIAKRGALFMINLLEEVKARGGQVIHIKTDSIKVVDPTPELEEFIFSYGKEYGYNFDIESVYDRICLVNHAVYIAYEGDHWTATGAQFAEPYVFKTLFSGEELEFNDLTVTKSVSKGKMFIDKIGDGGEEHNYDFVGSVGKFCPVVEGLDGSGQLVVLRDDKYNAVSGTKGWLWKEAELVKELGEQDYIDRSYFEELANKAKEAIEKFGSFEKFVKGDF